MTSTKLINVFHSLTSFKQPYSQQACSGCKAAVTKSRSAHWEGGKGCRDKVAMSRSVHVFFLLHDGIFYHGII